jgi:hypothetical protein
MLVALVTAAVGLTIGVTKQGNSESRAAYVDQIRKNNEKVLTWWLIPATWVFAVAIACFLAALIWAAYAKGPPPTPQTREVRVVVKYARGPRGARGSRGPQGPEGPPGDATARPSS